MLILAGDETGELIELALVNSGQLVMRQMNSGAAEFVCSHMFSPVSLGSCGLWAGGRLVLAILIGAELPTLEPPVPWRLSGQSLKAIPDTSVQYGSRASMTPV